ncbi:MAG TPA: divalent metal cation transporter, partial [Edaphobacter sp.]
METTTSIPVQQEIARRPSLPNVHSSVRVSDSNLLWKRALGFVGPGFMVAVGYMDPGNWATDLAA